jgi:hypothetical protein
VGRTVANGYGAEHKRMRRRWAPLVEAGGVVCWRCGEPIAPGGPWDLGHDRGVHRGPEHVRCNRSASRGGPRPEPRRHVEVAVSRPW